MGKEGRGWLNAAEAMEMFVGAAAANLAKSSEENTAANANISPEHSSDKSYAVAVRGS